MEMAQERHKAMALVRRDMAMAQDMAMVPAQVQDRAMAPDQVQVRADSKSA
jgi:hypothetical protein